MIGLYVQHDSIRAVDIVRKANTYVLRAIAEQSVGLPKPDRIRPLSTDETEEYLTNFTQSLDTLLADKAFRSSEIAVAIDIRNAFVHTIPFDGNFSPDNINTLIKWELSQYFPDVPISDFLFDTYNPGFNPAKDKSPKFIYTAVLRSYIHVIQRGIRSRKMSLVSINVDQFAMENMLRLMAYHDKKREHLSAICFRLDDILYCSLLWNFRLIRFREYTLDRQNPPESRVRTFLASVGSSQQKSVEQRIYYYPFDESVVQSMRGTDGWQCERFRALDYLRIKRRAKRTLPESELAQEGFAPAIAVALR